MGKVTGFLEVERHDRKYAPVEERIKNYREFVLPLADADVRQQASRCMDCGVPYCHGTSRLTGAPTGCPVNNQIPDWNDLVYRGNWEEAARNLHSTNNFPEFTGRVCPAPCEASCTLNIDENPVTIKTIECEIADRAIAQGLKPDLATHKTGKKVAVVGSGPAGLAAAQQLARAGHGVHVYERWAKAGGLLRYGIPDFKMEKIHVDRRVAQMEAEGVTFRTSTPVGGKGKNAVAVKKLLTEFDAVVVSGGAESARDLPIPGRELKGVHFAMEFLPQQNKINAGDKLDGQIMATGKHVVVIGGGDTGSDCVGTSNRHGATSVMQVELLPQPPAEENRDMTWPYWPLKLRTSSSHEEGCERDWAITSKAFKGEHGQVKSVLFARVEWKRDEKSGVTKMVEVPGSEFEHPADLVLFAMGFVGPVHSGLIDELELEKDARGNVKASTDGTGCYQTSNPKVFAAGDMRRGQSLVVWAIREGRQCARAVDEYLMGESVLPR